MINFVDLSPDIRLAQVKNILGNTLDNETVLLNTESGMYFSTNEVGSELWSLLSDSPTWAELVLGFEEMAGASAPKEDLYSYMSELHDAGLIEFIKND